MDNQEAHESPLLPLAGLVIGVLSGVVHPGLFNLAILTWLVPALIAGLLSLSPRSRPVAAGFAAASVGWLAFCAAVFVFGLVGPLLR